LSNYYYQDEIAPPASSLHIGTAVAIRYGGCILFDHRRDGKWGLIGGALEIGESLEECVRREVREETRLELTKLELLGTFSHPSRIIERYDGVVQSVTICMRMNIGPPRSAMLRHSAGYKLANDGQDTRAIQHYMGHKNIQHTVWYTELTPARFKDFWKD
jgi:ADP-ribose pyrophosphatase YjhB (NUDIX family)